MLPHQLFELLAATTWRTILRANRNRITYGEDAITSVNLNAIATANPASLAIEDARIDEAHKGCDFEMWIGTDRAGWSRYAVQAKKITVNTSRYDKLHHLVRGRPQIDILNDYATRVRAAPIYCLYTFAPTILSWNCSRPVDRTQLGCMVTPLAVVQDALNIRGARNFTYLHMAPETLPWRCLIRCAGHQHHQRYQHLSDHVGAPRAPSRWPGAETYRHNALPEALRALRLQPRTDQLIDPAPLSPKDESLYPRWTVVVDTTDELHE